MAGQSSPVPLSEAAQQNVRTIIELERSAHAQKSWSEALSDRILAFAGSLAFVLVQLAATVAWTLWNAVAPVEVQFDPYPYGLLTIVVSLEALLIATFVLIAQNRMSQRTERRDHLHLQVALLTEQELTLVLRMLRQVSEHLHIPPETEDAAKADRMTEETNVPELMETLKRELPSTDQNPAGQR
ncbi:MAG: DUF1003 domain-containing protein [Vicinamibacteria bacterium]|nr:DUF1003 domain-containing protein [Vicinamibacteria bacterium]